MRVWLRVLIVGVVLTLVGCYWFWSSFGLKEFWEARNIVEHWPDSARVDEIRRKFTGEDSSIWYTGILAANQESGKSAIWVWGRNGLRYFLVDIDTVYSHYDMCSTAKPNEGSFEVGRTVSAGYGDREQPTLKGYYVEVLGIRNDGIIDTAREVRIYNWWAFMPEKAKVLCRR